MSGVLLRERRGRSDRHEKKGHVKTEIGRDQRDSATNHGTPGPLEAERSKEDSFATDLGGNMAL